MGSLLDAESLLLDMLSGLRKDVQENTKALGDLRERMIILENNINGISLRLARVEEWRKLAEKELEELRGLSSIAAGVKKWMVNIIVAGFFGALVLGLIAMGAAKKFFG